MEKNNTYKMYQEAQKEKMNKVLEKNKKAPSKVSIAKAGGLKSTFAIGDEQVLMTTFGKGNSAICEKLIEGNRITNYENNLDVKTYEKSFSVDGKRFKKEVATGNPLVKEKVGKDIIDRKDVLEEKYFGQTFKDNIHIQLIYNIMDIEKILSIHINNILYGLDNILNRGEENADDFIGVMQSRCYEDFCNDANKYNLFKSKLKKKQLSYYGAAFHQTGYDTKSEIKKTMRRSEKDIYYILSTLATVRNFLAHSHDHNRNKNNTTGDFQVILYTFDEKFDSLYKDKAVRYRLAARELLDDIYDARVIDLNEGFLEKAKTDMTFIYQMYNVETVDDKMILARKYYDFMVRKDYKYLGFSIKKLRELVLSTTTDYRLIGAMKDHRKVKLNHLYDFAIYMFYEENPQSAKNMVEKLRACGADENAKDNIYINEAIKLVQKLKKVVNSTSIDQIYNNKIHKVKVDAEISQMGIEALYAEDWKPVGVGASYFTKIIYLITLFLDGKEINDLVTTLINKFDNIHSFNEVIGNVEIKGEFVEEYKLFADSKKIVDELCVLNSFARMELPGASVNRTMFVEAAKMLGAKDSVEELEEYFDGILDAKCNSAEKGFKNFIRNNVVKSRRFKYLIRYCNIESIQSFSKNKALVNFVMKDIPKDQILRYYTSCVDKKAKFYNEKMRVELSQIITQLSFVEIKSEWNNMTETYGEEWRENAKDTVNNKKNIINLYLTVCYMFFKNLVNVNSRYFLAFYCLERDMMLWGMEKAGTFKEDRMTVSYNALTQYFLGENKISNKPRKIKTTDAEGKTRYVRDEAKGSIPAVYIKTNLEHSDDIAIHSFRNSAEHLNAVRNASRYLENIEAVDSYYQIYHYITQFYLKDLLRDSDKLNNSKTNEYFELLEENNSYCKDFVKALCVPFGYNLARFKNLSIDGLFDMNDTRKNKKTGIDD